MTTATANKYAFLIQSSIDGGRNWYTEAKSNSLDRAAAKVEKIREEYKFAYRVRAIQADSGRVVHGY